MKRRTVLGGNNINLDKWEELQVQIEKGFRLQNEIIVN